jgi:iron-sulfur cluster assembly protein
VSLLKYLKGGSIITDTQILENYVLGFDEKSREEDLIINSHGLTCFIDPNSLLHLSGTRIDFVDEPNRRGFVFDNPNVQPSCDCGDTCCG